jgi:hypothetical protein
MIKVVNRDIITRMRNYSPESTEETAQDTSVNRSVSTSQEQTRKGPDMETRLKDLEELTAKLEERISKLESLHNQK